MDESIFFNSSFKEKETYLYIFAYYYLNIIFGIVILIMVTTFFCQWAVEHVQASRRENILNKLDSKIIEADGN